MMETTATYDTHSKEFIINTPSAGAVKAWITNSAIHAHFAVVFARIIVGGEDHGVHAFIVPIRDTETHEVLPGCYIEDMGYKMGCNGVDNGRLAFSNVRVPRTALLNRYSEVSESGQFSSTIRGKRQRFIKVADQLLSGRLCISSMMLGLAKQILTITVRYSCSRLAVGPSGDSNMPILGYQLQQQALAPLTARLYACNIALNHCKDRYVGLQPHADNEDIWREVVVLCCEIKPMIVWLTERIVSICRERCGGGGYLSINRFGDALGFAHAGITAEGDASVLMQKAAKEMLTLVQQGRLRLARISSWSSEGNFCDDGYLRYLLSQREAHLVGELSRKMSATAGMTTEQTGIGIGKSQGGMKGGIDHSHHIFNVWMMQESALVQASALAHIELVAFDCMCRSESSSTSCSLRSLRGLYALDIICREMGYLVGHGIVSNGAYAVKATKALHAKCAEIGPLLTYYTDAFGIPPHLITAPIAGDWTQVDPRRHGSDAVTAESTTYRGQTQQQYAKL